MGAYGTSLAAGALSNAFGDTFKGMAEGAEKAPGIEQQSLQTAQARQSFPLEQQQRQAQTEATKADTALAPWRERLMNAQAQRLLMPEPLNTPFGVFGLSPVTGQVSPLAAPKVRAMGGADGLAEITDPAGNITYTQQATPERRVAAQQYFDALKPNDVAGTMLGLMKYRDIFGDKALSDYVRRLNAMERHGVMRDVAGLRAGGAGARQPETVVEERETPPKPIDFFAKADLGRFINSNAVPTLQEKNPEKWAQLPPHAQAILIQRYMQSVGAGDLVVGFDPKSGWYVASGMTPQLPTEKTTKKTFGASGRQGGTTIFNFGNDQESD